MEIDREIPDYIELNDKLKKYEESKYSAAFLTALSLAILVGSITTIQLTSNANIEFIARTTTVISVLSTLIFALQTNQHSNEANTIANESREKGFEVYSQRFVRGVRRKQN